MTKLEALKELLGKVEAGERYETMGHTIMCQKAFPLPHDFGGTSDGYANSAAQQAILVWRNGSLDAAKALHETVFPGGGWLLTRGGYCDVYPQNERSSPSWALLDGNPARAWLIAILKALISIEEGKAAEWKCPINHPGCTKNCGSYGCGN